MKFTRTTVMRGGCRGLRHRRGDVHHRGVYEDERDVASPTGLPPDELAATLREAMSERGGGHQAAVELLARCGGWLPVLDAAGFIAVGPPSGRDPELRPRAVVRWADAVGALEHGGALNAGWDHHRPALDDRVLRIAASLADGPAVELGALLGDLDRERTRCVLAAVEAASQAHVVEYEWRLPDGRDSGRSGFVSVPPIVPWPEADRDSGWQQAELPLWPERVAEEEAVAWAAANPSPTVDLPLTGPVADLLSRLRAPGGMRGGGLGMWSGTPISGELRTRTPADVETWLGGPLPEVPPLVAAGQRCWCFSRGEEGDEAFEVVLCWVPAGTSIHQVEVHRPAERGATVLHVRAGAEPTGGGDRRTRLLDPAGGYTSVLVRGRRVGVQRCGHAETNLGWVRQGGADHQFLRLHVPRLPPQAVELLLQGENLV